MENENRIKRNLEKILVGTLVSATIVDGISIIVTGQPVSTYLGPEWVQGLYSGITKFGPATVIAGLFGPATVIAGLESFGYLSKNSH